MNWRVLIVALLLPSFAAAQTPPIEAIPPGEDKIVVLKEGESAPFPGQLFDPYTAIRWANWLQQYKYRLDADVKREQALCSAKGDYQDKVLTAEKIRAQTVETDLRARLLRSEQARLKAEEELRNPSWLNTREFGIVLGSSVSLLILGLGAWAFSSAK